MLDEPFYQLMRQQQLAHRLEQDREMYGLIYRAACPAPWQGR